MKHLHQILLKKTKYFLTFQKPSFIGYVSEGLENPVLLMYYGALPKMKSVLSYPQNMVGGLYRKVQMQLFHVVFNTHRQNFNFNF
jgi:hypothetical protein